MGRQKPIVSRRSRPAGPAKPWLRSSAATVSTRHSLVTRSWVADVESVEGAIGRFAAGRPLRQDCEVVLFELPGDVELHVNVMHPHRTVAVPGWAGPGKVQEGYVHNRRFGHEPTQQIVRHIRDMVFAVRDTARPRA